MIFIKRVFNKNQVCPLQDSLSIIQTFTYHLFSRNAKVYLKSQGRVFAFVKHRDGDMRCRIVLQKFRFKSKQAKCKTENCVKMFRDT